MVKKRALGNPFRKHNQNDCIYKTSIYFGGQKISYDSITSLCVWQFSKLIFTYKLSPNINFIIILLRNGSHQIPHWDTTRIHLYIFKLDLLSNPLSLIFSSINTTSLSKLECTHSLAVYYMPRTGLAIENSEMNETWVDFSHVIRKLTLQLGKEKGN